MRHSLYECIRLSGTGKPAGVELKIHPSYFSSSPSISPKEGCFFFVIVHLKGRFLNFMHRCHLKCEMNGGWFHNWLIYFPVHKFFNYWVLPDFCFCFEEQWFYEISCIDVHVPVFFPCVNICRVQLLGNKLCKCSTLQENIKLTFTNLYFHQQFVNIPIVL